MARKPVVAGMFYEDFPDLLDKQITECFKSKFGPVDLPANRKDKKIMGVIAPHAGYQFSGPGQAWCYKEIAESEPADCYVILGTSHTGFPGAAITLEDFETPFGIVKIDNEFAKGLLDKGVVVENRAAHKQEHSIEVQLPFLQFINKENLNKLRIVPIVIGQGANYNQLGKAIKKTAEQAKKKIILICSSDFTHYGISYGYLPFKEDVKNNLERLDTRAIKFIKNLDAKGFLSYIDKTEATICGCYAIAAFIESCKELGAKNARLESYYSSGDVTNDWSTAVGYASIIVE